MRLDEIIGDKKFTSFMNTTLGEPVIRGAERNMYKSRTKGFKSMPSYKTALQFGVNAINKLDKGELDAWAAFLNEKQIAGRLQHMAYTEALGTTVEDFIESGDLLPEVTGIPEIHTWRDFVRRKANMD